MDVEIIASSDNQLLDRKEITAAVSFSAATPTRKEIKEAVCGKMGANPELAVISDIRNEYGIKRVKVSVHIYNGADSLKRIEPPYIKVREGLEEKAVKKKKEAPKKAAKKD